MGSKMEKRYGLPTAISMVIGIVIGSGVFIKGGRFWRSRTATCFRVCSWLRSSARYA